MQMQYRFFTREAPDQNVFTRDVTFSSQSWNAEARTFSVVVSRRFGRRAARSQGRLLRAPEH